MVKLRVNGTRAGPVSATGGRKRERRPVSLRSELFKVEGGRD